VFARSNPKAAADASPGRADAASDLAACVARAATARAGAVVSELTALRAAFDAAAASMQSALASPFEPDPELAAIVGRLTQASDAAAERHLRERNASIEKLEAAEHQLLERDAEIHTLRGIQEQLRARDAEVETLRAVQDQLRERDEEIETLRAVQDQLRERDQEIETLRAVQGQLRERDKEIKTLRAVQDQLRERDQEIEGLRALEGQLRERDQQIDALKGVQDQLRERDQEIEALRAVHDQLRARGTDSETVQAIGQQLAERDTEIEGLRAMLVKARMDLEAARADLAAERADSESLRAGAAAELTGDFDRALDELRRDHATAIAEESAACTTLPLDELLTVFASLRRASTGPELLGNMLSSLAREFSRVALFHVDGTRLVAAERFGFTAEAESKPVRLSNDSLLTRAATTGRLESVITSVHGEPNAHLPFGGTPACALAMPIVFQGTTSAIIYADDSDHVEFATAAPQARLKFAELLQQYATLVLLKISVEQQTVSDLRAFVAGLIGDLEYTYAVETEAGRNRLSCQQRLKEALQSVRKRFAEHVEGGDPAAAGLLEDALVATADARQDSAFGHDLTTLIGSARRGGRGNIVTMFR
jgi:hypothetical protein